MINLIHRLSNIQDTIRFVTCAVCVSAGRCPPIRKDEKIDRNMHLTGLLLPRRRHFINTRSATKVYKKEEANATNCSKASPVPSVGCSAKLKKAKKRSQGHTT